MYSHGGGNGPSNQCFLVFLRQHNFQSLSKLFQPLVKFNMICLDDPPHKICQLDLFKTRCAALGTHKIEFGPFGPLLAPSSVFVRISGHGREATGAKRRLWETTALQTSLKEAIGTKTNPTIQSGPKWTPNVPPEATRPPNSPQHL